MAKRASTSSSGTSSSRTPSSRSAKPRAKPKKAAARKRAAPATAPAAGTSQAKAAAPKRAPAKRAGPKRAAARKTAAPGAALRTKAAAQRFTVNHLREEDFRPDGLRPYARYRDLGVAAATGGLARAHVIRMIPPVTDEVRQRHFHDVELQLVYVLKGWMKNEFEGHGVQMMEQGSCWLQPPGIPHTVLDYSDDLEVLEIIIPAEFGTEPVD